MRQGRASRRMIMLPLGVLLSLVGGGGCAEVGQVLEQALEWGLSAWPVLTGIISIAGLVGVYFTGISVMDRTRKEFQARRPDVHLVQAYCISVEGSYAAVLTLHNTGNTPASDGVITLEGWPGKVEFGPLLPVQPGLKECKESIDLGQESLIRSSEMDTARLWIRYRDQWGYTYEVSYPVLQERGDHGFFDIKIQTKQPSSKRPSVGFWKMRKILRETPG